MARIAYLLLAHKQPGRVIAQAGALTAHGDTVTIHYDRRASQADFNTLRTGLADNPNVVFAPRVKCGWGTWSLVRATLNMIRTAKRRFTGQTHYYLISGDCYPTKSRSYIDRFLERQSDKDFIEAKDFFAESWIRTGLTTERLFYRHWFNEREQKWLFDTSLDLQMKLGLARKTPERLPIHIGSQWWLLRAGTVDAILDKMKQRPEIERFFRTTWIPDEIFFQTMAVQASKPAEIYAHPPTHLIFSDYGMPVEFYDDHYAYLRAQDWLFARKLSDGADALRERLLSIYSEDRCDEPEGGTPYGLYPYLTNRGRQGRRYAPRFWEQAIDATNDGEILIIAAKIWHVGKAVEETISGVTGLGRLGYLFEEESDADVSIGNLEHGVEKRNRHRRVVLNLMMRERALNRALICVDPGRLDIISDLVKTHRNARILIVERPISDAHIDNHGIRTNLIGPHSGAFERTELRRALREEFETEAMRLADSHRDIVFRNHLDRTHEDNVLALGHFLRCRRGEAEVIATAAEQIVS
ncbi:glycosyl transferase [Rhodobacteraceae bacterium NNCM2]|nr:glycosyl transferase [Coraliihabitans acroporae]